MGKAVLRRSLFWIGALLGLGGCEAWNETWLVLWANESFRHGHFQEALQIYWDIAQAGVETPRMQFNIGCVYRALGEATSALRIWKDIEPLADTELAFRLAYNLGHVAYERGDFAYARDQFRRALILKPGDRNTRHNFELSLSRAQNASAPSPSSENAVAQNRQQARGPAEQEAQVLLDIIRRLEGQRWKAVEEAPSPTGWSDY